MLQVLAENHSICNRCSVCYPMVFLHTHTCGVCALRNCLWCCVVLHVISLLFLSVSADYLFELADCSASLFVFRDASLVVLHVSFPEEAVSWLC